MLFDSAMGFFVRSSGGVILQDGHLHVPNPKQIDFRLRMSLTRSFERWLAPKLARTVRGSTADPACKHLLLIAERKSGAASRPASSVACSRSSAAAAIPC